MVLKPNDYFKVLGLSRNASIKDIKTAYFKLAREWHPDYNKTPDAVRKFRLITEAYEVLKDNDKRTEYILRNHDIGRDYEYVNSNRNNQTKSEWSDYTYEEKQRYKENYDFRMRSLLFFERLIHPRTLIILIPLYLFGNLIYCSFYPVDSNVKRYSKGRDDEMIDAWFNSKSNRWETAAPNNPEYIKSVKNGEIKRKHWKEVYRSK